MNKKGAEDLLMNVVCLTFIGIFLVIFLVWIGGLATGKIAKSELMSKEIALLIDAAKPYTEISVAYEPGKIEINPAEREVIVSFNQINSSYDYFSLYHISSQQINETFTVIKIEK